MENTRPIALTLAVMLGIALLIAVLIFVLQVPSISIRRLLIGDRIVAGGQFWLLELLSGLITSTIITVVAVLLYKRLVLWIALMSAIMQLAWVGFSVTYVEPAGSIGSLLFRTAESTGIILGAAAAVLIVRGMFQGRKVEQ